MSDFRTKAASFLSGRYGFDKFNWFLFVLYVVLFFASVIVGSFTQNPIVNLVFLVVMTAVVVYMFFRLLSRSIYKRQRENERFLNIWSRIVQFFKLPFLRFRDRKTHKYVKCPSCKKYMRIKKGKGERYINCPLCARNFKVNS